MDGLENLTVGQRFKRDTGAFNQVVNHPLGRQDTPEAQHKLVQLWQEFQLVAKIIDDLLLFSSNEGIDEVSTLYIPFLNCLFYLGRIGSQIQVDLAAGTDDISVANKPANLQLAKRAYVAFLVRCSQYGLLDLTQKARIDGFTNSYDPLVADLEVKMDPMTRRAEKIASFKATRELEQKLSILGDYYGAEDDASDPLGSMDELVVRQIFIDQIRLHIIQTFGFLETLAMELQVLEKMPPPEQRGPEEKKREQPEDPTGYTERVELIARNAKVSDILSRQGKILQPFTLTSSKDQLRLKVFGTGQVLPSMTVEEYLDWELANGKMATEDPNGRKVEKDSDEEDSEEEYKARAWDDWKDDNPKGAGNIKGNIG